MDGMEDPSDLFSEDLEMAAKRARQIAALVPVAAAARNPELLALAIELSEDLSCALSNLI